MCSTERRTLEHEQKQTANFIDEVEVVQNDGPS
jgi:hypothetical protein